MEGTVKMCRIDTTTKKKLKHIAEVSECTMSDLIRKKIRELNKQYGIPTI